MTPTDVRPAAATMRPGTLWTACLGFDLQDEPGQRASGERDPRLDFLPQRFNVQFVLDERIADEIGIRRDDIQILPVLVGQRRNSEGGAWEVQALVWPQFGASLRRLHHTGQDALFSDRFYPCPNALLVDRQDRTCDKLREDLHREALHLEGVLAESWVRRCSAEQQRVAAQELASIARKDRSRTSARAAKVHEHPTGAPELRLCRSDMADHRHPLGMGPVCTIYSRTGHSRLNQ